jgi:hypothetical protein
MLLPMPDVFLFPTPDGRRGAVRGAAVGGGPRWALLSSCPDMQSVTHKNFQRS